MKILVNGKEHEFAGATVSYDQIAALVGRSRDRYLTIVYFSVSGNKRGTLVCGQHIPFEDGTHFEAVNTGAA